MREVHRSAISEFDIYPRPYVLLSSLRRETSCKDWTHRPHLKQHLYEGAEAIGLTGSERHKWVSDLLHLIDAGDVRKVISRLKKYRGQGQKRIASLIEYLQRFVGAVDYDYFRAIGLRIGSGEVESAHRYIPQKRLKIPGATWHPDTINPMLALRILRANGWWEDFWTKQSASAFYCVTA